MGGGGGLGVNRHTALNYLRILQVGGEAQVEKAGNCLAQRLQSDNESFPLHRDIKSHLPEIFKHWYTFSVAESNFFGLPGGEFFLSSSLNLVRYSHED